MLLEYQRLFTDNKTRSNRKGIIKIIEKPFMKYVLLILYAYIPFSFLLTVADIVMRFSISYMYTDYNYRQLIVVDCLGLLTQNIVFIYGFIMALKGNLTPKKTGMIIAIYFVCLCLTSGRMPNIGIGWKFFIIADLLLIVPSLLGAAATYQYFCEAKKKACDDVAANIFCFTGKMH